MIEQILKNFNINGKLLSYQAYGEGHINETFLCVFDSGEKYLLQKINANVFKNVPALMRNVEFVTDFLRTKLINSGKDPLRNGLTLIKTLNGERFYAERNDYYRVCVFIEGAICYQTAENEEIFYETAIGFGNFANLLSDFNANLLSDTIKDFHDTEKRYTAFEKAVNEDSFKRVKSAESEIAFALKMKKYAPIITNLLKSGKIPLRVTHNDTKLNNVLFDALTNKALAVIDLDTVMRGSLLYDFGDAIRSGCNSATEDEEDLSKVTFLKDYYQAFLNGYLTALGDKITPCEKEHLSVSALIMTLECGVRFLTDYLNGDTYFKIHKQNHNLFRARTQFKLVEEIERELLCQE
ncbi:MAG: phosphotransferase [Firmicutes bacterium]|nr:phosphotransferase [Bacillota bacterium]